MNILSGGSLAQGDQEKRKDRRSKELDMA